MHTGWKVLPESPRYLGRAVAASDRRRTEESPLLAVLSTSGDQPPDWLAAGQALQRLLLVGVQHGLHLAGQHAALGRVEHAGHGCRSYRLQFGGSLISSRPITGSSGPLARLS